jgi:hypothetical protein
VFKTKYLLWPQYLLWTGALLLLLLYYCLFRLDASTTQPSPQLQPEAWGETYLARPPVALASYADGDAVFFKNQRILARSAADKGIDRIYNYRRSHMDPAFYHQHRQILTQKRGGGYWLWKPYFILKALEDLPENALLIYSDSGVVFTKPIDALLKEMEHSSMLIAANGKPVPLAYHLKREAWPLFEAQQLPIILKHPAVWAFFMVVRNTAENRAFIAKWLEACTHADALTDAPFDRSQQEPGFDWHQHDQALLSALVALQPEKKKLIGKPTLKRQYGVVSFHRHPKDALTSPLLLLAGMPAWLGDLLWNNGVMQKLRS